MQALEEAVVNVVIQKSILQARKKFTWMLWRTDVHSLIAVRERNEAFIGNGQQLQFEEI